MNNSLYELGNIKFDIVHSNNVFSFISYYKTHLPNSLTEEQKEAILTSIYNSNRDDITNNECINDMGVE